MDSAERRAIEWDCAQLLNRFYGLLDEKRYDDLAGLFAADGVWVRLGKELIGPKAIVAAMAEREDWITMHVVTNIRIDIRDADHAETMQYITLYRHEGWDAAKGPAPVVLPLAILHHRDHLVREGDSWKFQRKSSRAVMINQERADHYKK